jgi:hypothetical protein
MMIKEQVFQEEHDFQVSLSYIARPCFKKKLYQYYWESQMVEPL